MIGNKLIKSDIKLTIGILVSNNIKYIRNVLEALKPLLNAVSSELIVVDTKGEETDGSIAVAKEYTDRIYPFVWCNDFSAARNMCLKHARGEWFLYLDDDECFDDVTEFIDFFQSGECEFYNSGTYYVRNYDSNGNYSLSIVGRMIRRRENTCFEGRVHESFNEMYAPRKNFSCFVHHYGYVFSNQEEAKKHQQRNVSILEKELAETGESPNICAQMVQELINFEDTAEQGYLFAVDVLKHNNGQEWLEDSCAQWIMLATVRYYIQKKEYKKAKEQYKYINEKYELNRMSCMALHGMMANVALEEQDNEAMLYHAEQYVMQFDWKQANEDEALNQMNLDVPRYAEQNYCVRILKIGAVAAGKLFRRKEMRFFLERLPESEKEATEEEENKISDMKTINNFQSYNLIKKDEQTQSKLIKSDIKLTIGMLVSNHIEYIRKAMDSLKPLLDAIPSELVVLDTMGEKTDGSIDIVKEYTDKVYPFTWCNDFSAARNVLLEHARGEWFLYMDDDEWFDDVQEFIDFFRSGESEEYYSGYYYTRDYLPNGKYSLGIAGRMVRRTDNTKFIGKVHETFNVMYAPNKQFSCFTHHYGYAYANEEEREKKQQRNVSILRAEIKEKGLSPQRAAQMAQELISREATLEEGYRFCLESIVTLEKQKELKNSCSQWLLVAMVRCFAGKDNKKVLEQAELIHANYCLTQIATMALAATVVTVAAAEENIEFVKRYCDIYLENWDWKQEHEDEALLQTNLDFPRFLTDTYYHNMIHMAAVIANLEENYELANRYWKRMPWDKEGLDKSVYQKDLAETIRGLKKEKEEKQTDEVKKLVPLLDILVEASGQIKQLFLVGDIVTADEYLGEMQKTAIALGTDLEKQIGEGSTTVGLLEQYCELLWQCSNVKYSEESIALADIICEAIQLVKESFYRETKKTKTILLFPAKAEDWYLFESYWNRAKHNQDKVHVIPIPYFEKNYDGTLGQSYYDGEKFPEDISIMPYNKYDYTKETVDTVVIQKNYDSKNLFWTVHPFFYAENLKKYANEIITIAEAEEISEKEPSKLEIVFMPYKASMWDSMESIWKTALADADCNVYVVPIPYYKRNSDFSFGERCYEGDAFPDEVPITHYGKYNLEQHRPDIIYIHNPYDEYNYVTSVDPRFYSHVLKQWTNMLVYVPYYVIANEVLSDENGIQLHICQHADKVILQSETLKKQYIDYCRKNNYLEEIVLEEKIVAFGSPKFDAVLNSKKEDYSIPAEWTKKIKNRKVVLYNTSISTCLKYGKKYLEKIQRTIEYFENREDEVLWWRPHPLLPATFLSLRKSLATEYIELVERYKNKDCGIYDDTVELHRAITYADLYYGDEKSSVWPLFSATGKPAVLVCMEEDSIDMDFEQDCFRYYKDNSNYEILLRNENPDGTSGQKIHQYIKKEVLVNERQMD